MTSLRRAPREVYRVYDEDEFWAHAERELSAAGGRAAGVGAADTRRRSLHRALVSSLLLSAIGAVGLLAIASRAPGTPRGRAPASARLLAAARSLISTRGGRAHVWHASASSGAPAVSTQAAARTDGALVGRVLERARVAPRTAPTSTPVYAGATSAPDAPAVSQAVPAVAQAPEAPAQAAAPSTVEPPPRARAAATAAPPAAQGQSEFGFER